MRRRNKALLAISIASLGAVLTFENCGGSIKMADTTDLPSQGQNLPDPNPTPTPSPTPIPTPTPVPGTVFQNVWTTMGTVGSPSVRCQHATTVVGTKLFVWGGVNPGISMPIDGGLLDVATGTWGTLSVANAPSGRNFASAVSTGTKVLVWGGQTTTELNSGSMYDVATNAWTAMANAGAPAARYNHAAVWTGTKMIVYGGVVTVAGQPTYLNSGGLFDPATNTWMAMSTSGAPITAGVNSGVWTGTRFVVWGGANAANGGVYDPLTNTWTAMSTVNAPSARNRHSLYLMNDGRVLVWGGINSSNILQNSGGIYNPVTNAWTPISTSGAPAGALDNSMAWTGSKLVAYETQIGQGGFYDPSSDTWNATLLTNAPSSRFSNSAAWVNNRFVIWGGCYNNNGTIAGRNDGAYFQ